jgi:hypothetical protein
MARRSKGKATQGNDLPAVDSRTLHQTDTVDSYLQVKGSVFGLPGARWVRRVYTEYYRAKYQAKMQAFDALECIEQDTKNRIRQRIAECTGQVYAYVAWEDVQQRTIIPCLILAPVIGLITSLLSTPIWLGVQRGIFGWMDLSALAIAVYLVYLAIAYLLVIASMTTGLPKEALIIGLPVVGALLEWNLKARWAGDLSPTLLNGLRAGLTGGLSASCVFMVCLYTSGILGRALYRRLRRRHPEETIIQRLCDVLTWTEAEPRFSRHAETRNQLIWSIEWVARTIEHDLPGKFAGEDPTTDVWLRMRTREMAADLRLLKRCVLLPEAGEQQALQAAVTAKLCNAAEDKWGLFERAEASPSRSLSRRLMDSLRPLVGVLFPLMLIGVVELLPTHHLGESAKNAIDTAAVGWSALSILSLLNPQFASSLLERKHISDLIGGKDKE